MSESEALRFAWTAWQGATARQASGITTLVVHRIEVSQEDSTYADTPNDIARFFAMHPTGRQATGGAMPYPLLIDATGTIHQCVPLLRTTPHAARYNPTSIGVACIGDFRRAAPPAAQYRALVRLLSALLSARGLKVEAIRGHDELAGGSRDPNKVCPGDHLPLAQLRADVAAYDQEPLTGLVWDDP